MSSLYANWKLRDVKGQMQEADAVKEHYWITYKFLGKGGARILRKDGTNENGEAVYYDYVSKLSGTLARLSRRLGVTDAAVKDEKIDFEKVKPRRAVAQAATTQADNAAQADKAGGEGRVVEKAEKKRKAADAAGPADRKAPVTNEPEVRAGKKEAQKNKKKAEEKAPEAAGGAGIDFTKPGGIDFTKPSGKEETGGGKAKAEQGSRIDFTKPSGIPFVKPGEKGWKRAGSRRKLILQHLKRGRLRRKGRGLRRLRQFRMKKSEKGILQPNPGLL